MTEPCDLPATEARRLIGTKKLSPVELMGSCIARIEAVDHAVNAVVARDFERAAAAAQASLAIPLNANRSVPAPRPSVEVPKPRVTAPGPAATVAAR